jgi:hypothetical protein
MAFLRVFLVGQRTGYRGFAEFLRHYQPVLDLKKPDAAMSNEKRWNKVYERIKQGKAAGPFDRPPFPNADCPHQAIVVRQFTVPKNKWQVECDAVRVITHGSYPRYFATNDITPRADIGVIYWTFSAFTHAAVKMGPGCWAVLADAKDAYKIFGIAVQDLSQQVKMIQDPASGKEQFFVDLAPTFGATYAADKWNRFARCLTAGWRAQGAGFNFFVDNFDQLVRTEAEAKSLMAKLQQLATELRLPLHEEQVAQKFKHLGWLVDLVAFTLTVPAERLEVVLDGLRELQQAQSASAARYESLLGLFTWLAQVVFWARPALGHMRKALKVLKSKSKPTGYVARQAKAAAAWMELMFRRANGTIQMTSVIVQGAYNSKRMCWEGDPDCLTAWADANLPESRWGRGWIIATPGKWQGRYLAKQWTEEQVREIIMTKEGQKASPRAELWKVLATAWEIHEATGVSKICVVNDCAPALRAVAKAYSDTEGMQSILEEWLPRLAERGVMMVGMREDRERLMPADLLARGQVQAAGDLLAQRWGWHLGSPGTRA